jgi:hypothetical protein
VIAVYKGDACYAPSASTVTNHTVSVTATTVTLESANNCPNPITLKATVAPPSAGGEVNFFEGGNPIGSATLVNGVASLDFDPPGVGMYSFTATYKGDGCYAPSTSNKVSEAYDCPTPTQLTLFLAEPLEGGAVELRWQFDDASGFVAVQVERAPRAEGPWTEVAVEVRLENGVAVAIDRDVEPSRTYWYRLVGRLESGAPARFGPFEATAGRAIERFALARVWPNPSRSDVRIDYAVARAVPVRLSVVDVQGREVAVLAEGAHQPGRYQAMWAGQTPSGPAPVGMYFIRYRVPGQEMTKRFVLAR